MQRTQLPLLLLLALAPSCFVSRDTLNKPIREESLARLVPGTTTASEIVELFGAPSEVVQLAQRSAYRYEYVQGKSAGLFLLVVAFYNRDARSDRVWLFFDEKDVLTHVGATFDAEQAEYAMPWEDLHDGDGS